MSRKRPLVQGRDTRSLFFRASLVFVAFALIAGFYLWAEHRAYLALALPYLPYLVILACPLMYLLMHRGRHRKNRPSTGDEPRR